MSAPTSASGGPTPVVPVLPDYKGACIANLVPRLVTGTATSPDGSDWMPQVAEHARQIVLLVVDGLGWEQLRARSALTPTLSSGAGIDRAITSIAPTTTAAALTSITTGRPPADHGILGYRLADGDQILNMLRWTLGNGPDGDARRSVPVREFQPVAPFPGSVAAVPVVSKVDFGGTGFTAAHLGDSPLHDYRVSSSLAVEVSARLDAGAPFVYAYYDGIDKVAHAYGLGPHYDAELVAVDRIVADVAAVLPPGAVLLVTADHGQIEVGNRVELLGREAMAMTRFFSGEGRFRWVHAKPGAHADLAALLEECYGDTTWVRTRDQLVDDGWFGGPLAAGFADRLGDVALVPFEPIAFVDPADTGENRLACRHGSLTTDEMLVPLVALGGN
ncbi:MAG TPA: alkaline phosphatase family protein [Acidimicrobiales bacterium]